MADNTIINKETVEGGDIIATLEDGDGVKHEKVVVEHLVAGVPTMVDESNPLPVKISSDIQIGAVEIKNGTDDTRVTVTPANALKVDGSAVTQPVSLATVPLATNAATASAQASILAAVDSLESIFTDIIGFETVVNLASAATYSSGLLALSPPYSQVLTNILSDRTGTMNIYWYSDSGGTDLVRTLTIAYTSGDGFLSFGAPAFTSYVKYEFTNSAGASTTDFYFTTKFLTKPVSPQIITLKAPIAFGMVGSLTRSVIVGETTAGGGTFVNVKVNPSGTLETNATLAAGTNYVGKVRLTDGTTDAEVVPLAGYNAQAVAIVDGSGAQITSFGGGTQYADGAVRGTATGTLSMGDDGTNIQSIKVDAAGELQVDVLTLPNVTIGAAIPAGTNNIGDVDILSIAAGTNLIGKVSIDQVTANANEVVTKTGSTTVVSSITAALPTGTNSIGQVTANAGTNLNTSALNLETTQTAMSAKLPATLGQKAMAASMAVVVASDQASIPVTLATSAHVWKSANYTSAQTGVNMWTPGASKKINLTHLGVSSYGTTAARVIIWIGATGDTTYTAGTDQLVWAGSFAPSATAKPGAILNFTLPIQANTIDYTLKITSDAAISLDISMYGYES
jgi:hypothetical protein